VLVPDTQAIPEATLFSNETEELEAIIHKINGTRQNPDHPVDCLIITPNPDLNQQVSQALGASGISFTTEESNNGICLCPASTGPKLSHSFVIMPGWDGNQWFPHLNAQERSNKLQQLRRLATTRLILTASETRFGRRSEHPTLLQEI